MTPSRTKPSRRFVAAGALLVVELLPASAFAHGGHFGELAGHSHWIGWAALGAAAALAALLGRRPKPQSAEETDEQPGDESADDAGEEQSA